MRKPLYTTSSANLVICPGRGRNEPQCNERGAAYCARCDRDLSGAMLETLKQIAALPDPAGSHACECGYPKIQLLPDGVFRCPACGSEVLSLSASYTPSGSRFGSEARRRGWEDGLFGKTQSFVHNDELANWRDADDRLDYYQGHRAGRAARADRA